MSLYKYKKAILQSAVILVILALSVVIGFLYQVISDRADRAKYPQPYSEYVTKYSTEYGVPEYIIYSTIKVESSFNSNAESSAGAIGLMQIMPDTFEWLVSLTKDGYEKGMLYDPETNIKYGTYYLSYLYLKYNDWKTVYAAYNAGPSAVDEWLAKPEYTDDAGKLKKIPFAETEKYVKKVSGAVTIYQKLYYNT